MRELCARSDEHAAHLDGARSQVGKLRKHVEELKDAVQELAGKVRQFYEEAAASTSAFAERVKSAFETMEGRDTMLAAAMSHAAGHQHFQQQVMQAVGGVVARHPVHLSLIHI